MGRREIKIGLRAKFTLFFLFFGSIMLCAMVVMVFLFASEVYLENCQDNLENVVSETADILNNSEEQIRHYAETGEEDEQYRSALERMDHIRELFGLVYLYILYPTEEDEAVWVFYTVDTDYDKKGFQKPGDAIDDYNTEKYSKVRELYAESQEQSDADLTEKKESGKYFDTVETDAGDVISIYYLLTDSQNKPYAVLGADVLQEKLSDTILDNVIEILAKITVLIAALLFLLLLFLHLTVIRSVRKLKNGVQRLADGELGVQIASKRRDEIGDITRVFNRMSESIHGHIREMEELNQAYQKFVPQETFGILGKGSVVELSPGDQAEVRVTVLSMEPCDFNEQTKRMSSEETFCYINSILERLIPAVHGNGGTVVQFRKAGIRSLYRKNTESALVTAVLAGEEMRACGQQFSAGIAQGTVMMGIAGQSERMDVVRISEQIKLSEYLMRIAPKYNASILLTKNAAEQIVHLSKSYHCRFLGYIKMASSAGVEGIYDVYDADKAEDRKFKRMTKEQFEQGVNFFCTANYSEARQAFIEVLRQYRRDAAAREYVALCSRYLQERCVGDVWIEVL